MTDHIWNNCNFNILKSIEITVGGSIVNKCNYCTKCNKCIDTLYLKISNPFICMECIKYIKNQAALIIQKQWDICRYNPKYKICKNILAKEYEMYYR